MNEMEDSPFGQIDGAAELLIAKRAIVYQIRKIRELAAHLGMTQSVDPFDTRQVDYAGQLTFAETIMLFRIDLQICIHTKRTTQECENAFGVRETRTYDFFTLTPQLTHDIIAKISPENRERIVEHWLMRRKDHIAAGYEILGNFERATTIREQFDDFAERIRSGTLINQSVSTAGNLPKFAPTNRIAGYM